jgi:hypothetical protein
MTPQNLKRELALSRRTLFSQILAEDVAQRLTNPPAVAEARTASSI